MARRLPAKAVGAALDTFLQGRVENPEQLEPLLASRDLDQIRYLRRVLHWATVAPDERPDDRYDAEAPDPIAKRAWRAHKQPVGPPRATAPLVVPIQKSLPARPS